MIELRLGLIVDNIESFNFLAQQPMPAAIAFRTAHIIKEITDEYNLYQETRKKLIREYADKDAEGNLIIDEQQNVHLTNENLEIFNNQIEELKNTIIKIDQEKIPLEVLGQVKFTPLQMYVFEGIIEG